MHYRKFGNSLVSEIGFGAWQLGNAKDWSQMTTNEGIKLVEEAFDQGINFFDTAPNYGLGNSEIILGQALKSKRDKVVINTKFGHTRSGDTNFDSKAIKPSLIESLKALNTDYVDSLLLHNPPFEALSGAWGHFEVLEKLKEEGYIKYYGVSVDSSREMFEVLNKTNCEVMEVMFNIFHQETKTAFKLAKEKDVSLIIKVPLDSGFLSGKYDENSRFNDIRSRWSKEVIERRFNLVKELKKVIHDEDELSQVALKFILAHDEVTTVIPGCKNNEQLNSNVKASLNHLPKDLVDQLHHFYDINIKDQPLPW